ncbi:hypothetical protein [Pseudanabaena sp. 'Roaring Creek']|uniref:hypothetical protein n=1 Tax=Pseudanabaena sp. 'Roaring Creek' TaxID=1681830 RepID=UPI0006D7A83C|nr:hypothetical protein [Pseudanabaena sp. 'Roaring Creek']
MPTPDIDNSPEQIDIPDQLPTVDRVPSTLTPDQSSETLTSGTDNPQPQIERNTDNLVAILNRLQNLVVTQFFEPRDSDSVELAEQRQYFKDGLMIDVEADSAVIADIKCRAMDRFIGLDTSDLAKVYSIPIERFQASRTFEPQIKIIFKELTKNEQDLPLRNYYLEKEVSFPILEKFIPKTEDELKTFGDKIIDAFDGFSFTSAKDKYFTYKDKQNGFEFTIYAERDITKNIIEKVLNIQEVEFDEPLLVESSFTPSDKPQTIDVMGKKVNKPKRGRWGDLRLHKIQYHIKGIEPKDLYG